MAIEEEIKAVLLADSILVAILGARIYTAGTVGRDGLTEEATPEIFLNGKVLPSLLIKTRDRVADGQVVNYEDRVLSSVQNIELHIYEEKNYENIDAALTRLRYLLLGYVFVGSFELEWVLEINRAQDDAALAGASYARQDWSVNTIL